MNWRKIPILMGLLIAVPMLACADLTVPNENNPDTRRALANPGDVESLIAGGYRTLHFARHSYSGAGPAVSNLADEHTTNVANAMQLDLYTVPRSPLQNTTSYSDAAFIEYVWYRSYRAAKAAYDGLRQIREEGLTITDSDGNDVTKRAEAFAKFVQGVAHGTLAELYDKAFVLSEDLTAEDISAGLEFQRYDDVMAFAVTALDEAASIANANSFTVPATWVGAGGTSMSSDQLARVANSYAAKFMAGVARTPAERAAVDWTGVISRVDAGITDDFWVLMDDVTWWADLPWVLAYPIWGFWDMRFVGLADNTGALATWLADPVQDRLPQRIASPDNRYPATTDDGARGTYVAHYKWDDAVHPWGGICCQKPERGTYNHSYYKDRRDWLWTYITNWDTPIPELVYEGMQLLKAEGLYRNNDMAGAAAIVNNTRVTNGGLTATDASGTNAECVPLKLDGTTCGDLMDMIKYEYRTEVYATSIGDWYYHQRGWGDLDTGVMIQFPVPASELEVLQIPLYTFGGDGGNCSVGSSCDALSDDPVSTSSANAEFKSLNQYLLFDRNIETRLAKPRGMTRIR